MEVGCGSAQARGTQESREKLAAFLLSWVSAACNRLYWAFQCAAA